MLLLSFFFGAVICTSDLVPQLRYKRQYYVCGTYPNQYYSYTPCQNVNPIPPSNSRCYNGGRLLGVGCNYDFQCTPYSYGAPAVCSQGCCCTVPTPTQPPNNQNLGYCTNGQRSQVVCSTTSGCAQGQSCMNGLCCTTTGQEYMYACGGMAALSSCNAGSCGQFICSTANYCCECRFGQTSGLATNGCPSGYQSSSSGYCCPFCPSGRNPFGTCYNGQCPTGYTCRPGNICCQ